MTFSPAESRDADGKWTTGGGGVGGIIASALTQTSYAENIEELKQLTARIDDKQILLAEETAALSNYTGDNFETINSGLRKASRVSQQVLHIDSAITKSVLTKHVVVYRGVGRTLSQKIEAAWKDKKSASFVDKAFVSTSTFKKTAEKFSKNTIEITIPKGTHAFAIPTNGEAELLLGRGHRFKVTGFTKTAAGHKRIKAELVV